MKEIYDDDAIAAKLIEMYRNKPDTLQIIGMSAEGSREIPTEKLIAEISQRTPKGLALIAAYRRTKEMINEILGKS